MEKLPRLLPVCTMLRIPRLLLLVEGEGKGWSLGPLTNRVPSAGWRKVSIFPVREEQHRSNHCLWLAAGAGIFAKRRQCFYEITFSL